jgi:chaperonin GroEL
MEQKPGEGIDVQTGEKGDMIKMGIIDPMKVTGQALTNAVSVANTILSTNAIVTMARSYEAK